VNTVDVFETQYLDVLILGSGVAGLSAASTLQELCPGIRLGILTKAKLDDSTTRWAQGGIATVFGADDDSVDLHIFDTLAAGAGLCDTEAVSVLVNDGPVCVKELIEKGAVFDKSPKGNFLKAREGGHSTARVIHAGGTATGREVERTLVESVIARTAKLYENYFALDFVIEDKILGVFALDLKRNKYFIRADHVIVATGGAGQLYEVTTNPREATGDGIAMALRAGVPTGDLEFVQFHPTALHHKSMPRPLISEALRGYGAILRDLNGERFVDELAPRDVVSKAMASIMIEQNTDHLWLDATNLLDFKKNFPTIYESIALLGIDPSKDWLPVAPAAHYICGGILTDTNGATAVPGLWAAGEAALTGVHGANRLASNSLLEGMVFGTRIAKAISNGIKGPMPTGAMTTLLNPQPITGHIKIKNLSLDIGLCSKQSDLNNPSIDARSVRLKVQEIMTKKAGVLRTKESLLDAQESAESLLSKLNFDTKDPELKEVQNLLTVSNGLICAAQARAESRGSHSRIDYPQCDDVNYLARFIFGDLI
jgi:L-aspartate oxidase